MLATFSPEFIQELAGEISKLIQFPSAPEPLAYTIPEACKMMRLGETKLREEIKERNIAVVRSGSRVLLTREDMTDWMKRNRA